MWRLSITIFIISSCLVGAGRVPASTALAAPSRDTVAEMRVPDSAFIPALIDSARDRVESNAEANVDAPKGNHSQSYDSLGRVSGYLEKATWGAITFTYLASVYASPFDATNAFREGMATAGKRFNHAPEGCGSMFSTSCSYLGWSFEGKQGDKPPTDPAQGKGTAGVYYEVRYNQCVVELQSDARGDAYYHDRATITAADNAILTAANDVLKSTCGGNGVAQTPSLDYSIIVARVERAGAAPDYRLMTPGLKRARVGTPMNLVVYFSVRKAPPGTVAHAQFWVKQGNRILAHKQSTGQPVTATAGTYRLSVAYTPRSSGRDTVVGRVAISGWKQEWVSAITVVGKR